MNSSDPIGSTNPRDIPCQSKTRVNLDLNPCSNFSRLGLQGLAHSTLSISTRTERVKTSSTIYKDFDCNSTCLSNNLCEPKSYK